MLESARGVELGAAPYCGGLVNGSDWASLGVPNSILITKPFAPTQVLTAAAGTRLSMKYACGVLATAVSSALGGLEAAG